MTIEDSALTLLNAFFPIDQSDWTQVDLLFTRRYDSATKKMKFRMNWLPSNWIILRNSRMVTRKHSELFLIELTNCTVVNHF